MTISVECPKGGRHEWELKRSGPINVKRLRCKHCHEPGPGEGELLGLLNASMLLTPDDYGGIPQSAGTIVVVGDEHGRGDGVWIDRQRWVRYVATWRGETGEQ